MQPLGSTNLFWDFFYRLYPATFCQLRLSRGRIARFLSSWSPNLKYEKMKLSKSLLSAILLGIAIQAIPSCKKEKTTPATNKEKTSNENPPPPSFPDGCPACGMG
jgi:hypothetical protein